MQARPRRARPGADGDGRQPALLGRDAADPAHDRGAAVAGALDGDGPARDRRPAAGRARQPHLRLAERARPARLRGAAAAHRRPGRLPAPAAGRVGDPRPAPDRARRRSRHAGAGPGRLRPPAQVAGALARARPARVAATRRARRSTSSASPRTPAPRPSRPRSSPPWRRSWTATGCDPRPRQAQPLPLPRAAARGRPARALLAVRAAGARRPDRGRGGRRRDEVVCEGARGREPRRAGARRRCARAAGTRRRCGSRSRSGSRSPPGSAAAAPTPRRSCASPPGEVGGPARSSRRELGADVPSQLVPALSLVRGAGERVERLPDPAPHAVVLLPGGGGLSTAEVFAEADRLGLGRERGELDELAGRAARGRRRRRLAARLRRPARQRPRAGGPRRCAPRSATPSTRCAGAGAGHALLTGSGPTAFGALRRPRAPPSASPRASTATTRSSAKLAAPPRWNCRLPEDRRRRRLVIVAIAARDRRRLLPDQPGHPARRTPAAARGRLQRPRRLDLPAGRRLRLRRDRRLRRPRRPRRDGDAARRRRRRPGRDQRLPADRDRLVLRPGPGDTTSFFVGRRLGREFVLRHGPRFGIGHERFEQVEDYFDRHGGKTIFIGRFIGLVRALAPFIAGSSGMRYRAFVPYSILGTGIWASAHIVIGYLFSRSIDTAAKYAGRGAFILGTLIVVVVGSVYLYRRFRVEENRRAAVRWMEDHAATRWLVVLGRRFQPAAAVPLGPGHPGRDLRARVHLADGGARRRRLRPRSPTSSIVSGDPGPTPGDDSRRRSRRSAADRLAGRRRQGRHRARLGGGRPAAGRDLRPRCSAVRRRWAEVGVLLVGMAIVFIGVHEIKDGGRPAAAGGRRWSTPPGPRSRAAMPPTRPSTSGWR